MKAKLCNMIPMRDGVRLATDIWLPDSAGPHPTVVARTPYHRAGGYRHFAAHGYAVVMQDIRGRHDSEGEIRPLMDEANDGQDTIDWVAEQPWCNGAIGMVGASYLGFVQVPAAAGGHPALRCLIPQVTSASYFRDWARYDGCPALANALQWNLRNAVCSTNPAADHYKVDELYQLPTLEAIFDRVGYACETLRLWAAHDCEDDYWQAIDQAPLHEQVRVPAWHMGGWFDHHLPGQCETYQRLRDLGATAAARQGQRLLLGPWGHQTFSKARPLSTAYGDWQFGDHAEVDISGLERRFLDWQLRGVDDGVSTEPPVRVFVMGTNRWRDFSDWPPPAAERQAWHLRAGTDSGDDATGLLSLAPAADEAPHRYLYDPRNPMPTRGGPVYQGIEERGPMDQRPIMDRRDFACFQSAPLPQPLQVVGDPGLDLWIASSAVDTDFIARLCVVEGSGSVTCFAHGSLRCRYRESFRQPRPLAPQEPTAIHLRLGHTAYEFPAGSRVALLITSSCFPRIVPNLNTMTPPWSGTAPVVAQQTIFHDRNHPSILHLPVVSAV